MFGGTTFRNFGVCLAAFIFCLPAFHFNLSWKGRNLSFTTISCGGSMHASIIHNYLNLISFAKKAITIILHLLFYNIHRED